MPKALPKGTPGKTKPVWTIVSSRVSAPILENLTPPLKCTLVQKNKDSFFKGKKNIYFQQWNENTFESWNLNIQLQNLKVKGELGFL